MRINVSNGDYEILLRDLRLSSDVIKIIESGNRILIKGSDNKTIIGALVPIEDVDILAEVEDIEDEIESSVVASTEPGTVEDWDEIKETI